MLDQISRGAQGHGPDHLLLTSAAEVGFAWDGDDKCWGPVFSPSPKDDDLAHSTLLLFYPGSLALSCFS